MSDHAPMAAIENLDDEELLCLRRIERVIIGMRKTHKEERTADRERIAELEAFIKTGYCVWCDITVADADAMRVHSAECPKHPLRADLAEAVRLLERQNRRRETVCYSMTTAVVAETRTFLAKHGVAP